MILWMLLFIMSTALLLIILGCIALSRPVDKISIKESLDLCNLPVITFVNDGLKFNFLLDTGADRNHMSKKASNKVKSEDTQYQVSTTGYTGDAELNPIKKAVFTYKNKAFDVEFTVSAGLDKSFEYVKKERGVAIHGILGSDFLREYKYILDFDKLEVYTKRKWRVKL